MQKYIHSESLHARLFARIIAHNQGTYIFKIIFAARCASQHFTMTLLGTHFS